MRRLSARKVRQHRAWIAANRCPVRPGITHEWVDEGEHFSDPSYSALVRCWYCAKCGKGDMT